MLKHKYKYEEKIDFYGEKVSIKNKTSYEMNICWCYSIFIFLYKENIFILVARKKNSSILECVVSNIKTIVNHRIVYGYNYENIFAIYCREPSAFHKHLRNSKIYIVIFQTYLSVFLCSSSNRYVYFHCLISSNVHI